MKLVIVESPTKSKTIGKFLGKEYHIESSYGHIRDLPSYKLGVDVENMFMPQYVIPRKAQPVVKKLKDLAKKADTVVLATDEDREGEAIAWHLLYALGILVDPNDKKKKKEGRGKNNLTSLAIERIVFHEVTKKAIEEALRNPRSINNDLVDAQQARRVLDRLVGYTLSPFLWKKVARGLSAGRVQSVALRIVVDREKEIEAFRPATYWTIHADLQKEGCSDEYGLSCKRFEAELAMVNGESIPKPGILEQSQVKAILSDLKDAPFRIKSIEKKSQEQHPKPPYITSTLQQDSWAKLRFSAKKTMLIAQQLYEGVELSKEGSTGLITYMRTDSVDIAEEALRGAGEYVNAHIGKEYALDAPRRFKTKIKGAQEAHEAIRPVNPFIVPSSVKSDLTHDQFRLYDLIWRRFIATQMAPAVFDQTAIFLESISQDKKKVYEFRAKGSVLRFDGFLKITPIKTEDVILPQLEESDAIHVHAIRDEEHQTQPPPRYTEASLIKALEKHGIGRPSTYAPILSTIQERGYVLKNEKRQIVPTEIGVKVTDMLVEHFSQIVDIDFTAKMEHELDEVAEGKKKWQAVIQEFYGPFEEQVKQKYETVQKEDMSEMLKENCPECGKQLMIRHGRFGKFISCSGFPDCKFTKALPPQSFGIPCPQCLQGEVVERQTRKRRIFYGCSRYPACDFAAWQKPTGELCPICKSALVEMKNGSRCSNKECNYKK